MARLKVVYIPTTGQSNSVGVCFSPPLSTKNYHNTYSIGTTANSPDGPIVPLVEPVDPEWSESISSSMAAKISISNPSRRVVVGACGKGSHDYSILKKGSARWAIFERQLKWAKYWCDINDFELSIPAVPVVHGEGDSGAGTLYYSYCLEWQSDIQAAIQSITGLTNPIPLVTVQLANHRQLYNLYPSSYTGLMEIPLIQIKLSQDFPNLFRLIPSYQLSWDEDGVHRSNIGHRYAGQEIAKEILRIEQGLPTAAIRPLSATMLNPTTVRVSFGTIAPLTFDAASIFNVKVGKGFEFSDSTGSATVTGATASGTTVDVALSAAPTGTNRKIRYAWSGNGKPGTPTGVGGSLRDTDADRALYYGDQPLYNWCPIFELPIT